jgi:hypothetical protein
MARKLKNLLITEISSVDAGANPGARVLLMKRDAASGKPHRKPRRPRTLFDLQESARAAAREEKLMTKTYRKMMRAYARPSRPPAAPPPLDIAKIDRRIAKGLAKGQPFEVAATRALRKSMATAGGDPEYFENVRPGVADYTRVREIADPDDDVDDPFAKMWKAALDLSGENGETPEVNFSRIYEDPRNRNGVVAADKAHHLARTTANALPLPGAKPGWGPASAHNADWGDTASVAKQIRKLRDRGLDFEHAATAVLRGRAA